MTYTIPPGTPKSVKAAAFGRELVKALAARDVSIKEINRVTGVGHTSIDNYRRGLVLPKVEVARTLASVLEWPKLAEIIVAARTFSCARPGCGRTFRNDTGAPRKFCSQDCVEIKNKLATAARANRRAGQAGSWSPSQAAAVRTLRSGLRLADDRNTLLTDAIASMCAGCEPEGLCRTAECPLRPFSPLALASHVSAEPRTVTATRAAAWTPERRDALAAGSQRRWAQPGARAAAAVQMHQRHVEHPELLEHARAAVARRTPESFSEAATRAWVTRRARAAAAG